jgi:microcystin-dependent protein
MGLSRLSQLLSNTTGRCLYVNPDSIDSTDTIENRGNSPTRPFYNLNRAIAEAVRFSYQVGPNNDRFARCTIILSPGIHRVTNRPGWIPDGANNFRLRNGTTSSDFAQWDSNTNFDITTNNNALYKLNSVHGGIFLPRGVSIIGQDYRKTIIIPDYIPNPENDSIERAAIFLLTGQNFFNEITIEDPEVTVYKDYTSNRYAPLFSQHKLTNHENADGVNPVVINDIFQSYTSTRTDLQMYYEKIGLAFGASSGREIQPDYPSATIDIQPRLDEYRIVGSRGREVNISAIRAGDGITPTISITATLAQPISELDVDTPIRIEGIPATGYDGQYVVKQVISPTQVVYEVATAPVNAAPTVTNATLNISVDTVSSSSPYLFNLASKTVWGRNSLHNDGSKTSGFKSIVVAQYTGIGLQKDPKAFVKYNTTSGIFEDNTATGNENIPTDSRARYKPSYENFHVKASNDGYIQAVSVFGIGYANQFVTESGADQSINASNSNFGGKALVARGYRENAFIRDDAGYVTHVIPPKELGNEETTVTYDAIDVTTTLAVGISTRLYFYNRTALSSPPDSVIEGYRIGARLNEQLKVVINSTEYTAKVVLPNSTSSAEKSFTVGRSNVGINSVSFNVLSLTQSHNLLNGESVRIISETAQLPDGALPNQLYYVITTANTTQIKLAQTLNDAVAGNSIALNNRGGSLTIVSRVSDKNAGDIGHPIQYDSNGWYITVESGNGIYGALSGLSQRITQRTYLSRKIDSRSFADTIYKLRYVIPSTATVARPPTEGFVIQESGSTIGDTDTEVASLFNQTTNTLTTPLQLRNQKLIAGAVWSGGAATYKSELPHNLSVGSYVEIKNVKSTNNTVGSDKLGFNGSLIVTSILDRKQFTGAITSDPGTFTSNTSSRTTASPYFTRKKYKNTFYIYRAEEVQKHVPGTQDGIYYLVVLNASNSPVTAPFTTLNYSQPIQNLYPQKNRNNPTSDPKETTSFALSEPLGQVIVDEPQYSITKETLQKTFLDQSIGIGLTNIISNSAGTAHTIYTTIDHGLNPATRLSITSPGVGYGVGSGTTEFYYNARLVNSVSSGENATALVTVTSAGAISSIRIMDGGSNYAVGDRLSVVGIATTTGHTVGIVSVVTIYDHIGESLKVNKTLDSYNTSYRITGISSSKSVTVVSASSIASPYVSGIGSTATAQGYAELTGRTLGISSFVYSPTTGIATVTTINPHGLFVDSKFLFGGFTSSLLNNTFTVSGIVGLNTITVSTGTTNINASYDGTPYIFRQGASSNGGTISKVNENLGGRMVSNYAGITTTLSASLNATSSSVSILNALDVGLKLGDYLLVDEEIIRISTTVTGNNVIAFRGLLGTRSNSHLSGAYVSKILPAPIELRRNSLTRASAHTFEYTGYGSGNYSAALPDRQDRTLSPQEELISQSTKENGGIVEFQGMNANGNFFIGNKKINSATGTEELFNIPIPSVTGEDRATDNFNIGFNILNTTDATISRSLTVEGGSNKDIISQFDGPVVLNNKVISNSPKGIEALSLFLQGTANTPRQYTIGDSIPSLAGSPGDVQYNANPLSGGFLGWVYTSNNSWEKFGRIGNYGGSVDPVVGVSSGGTFVGLSTLIDFKTSGIILTSSFDSASGITTLNFAGASPFGNAVGVSTGSNTFVGMATQINFSGTPNIVISGTPPVSGIVTINVGLSSSAAITAGGFVKSGVTSTNFLKAGGADAALTSSDVTSALGFTPANSASIVGDPASGNSVILDALAAFDGVTTVFNLFLNGSLYTPFGGSANLIVSLGGITQKPGTDYYVNQNAGINTSSITFTTAPAVGLSHFIVALGGQSSLLGNPSWNAKGDLAVGITDNNAGILTVGTNGQVLTVDSTKTTGVGWSTVSTVPTTTVISIASTIIPTGFLECNGAAISRTTYMSLFSGIGTVFGSGNGSTTFNIPDLRGEFIRGWDNGRGIDFGRIFGSRQEDSFRAHSHNITGTSENINNAPGVHFYNTNQFNTNASTQSAGGTETRPRNIALMFCIKY